MCFIIQHTYIIYLYDCFSLAQPQVETGFIVRMATAFVLKVSCSI